MSATQVNGKTWQRLKTRINCTDQAGVLPEGHHTKVADLAQGSQWDTSYCGDTVRHAVGQVPWAA